MRDDAGFDLWQDVSTLYVKLFGENNFSSPLAEGVCKLNVANLAKLLAGFRATGCDSATEAAASIAKFTKFFLGKTLENYI